MQFKNALVLVVGYGITGKSVCRFLIKKRAKVIVFDDKEIKKKDKFKKVTYINSIQNLKLTNISFAVFSPGISLDHKISEKIRELNIKIISEIELAAFEFKGKIFAITGTNGKTTTTMLLYHIFLNAHKKCFLQGNVGYPFIDIVKRSRKNSFVALEVSSFQLETCFLFKPHFATFLSFSEDHLNRHINMENYFEIKSRLFTNQDSLDYSVLNYDDMIIRNLSKRLKSKIFYFSTKKRVLGVYIKDNDIYFNNGKLTTKICNYTGVKLLGQKNKQNVLAAVCMSKLVGIQDKFIEKSIKSFNALPHRLEFVTNKKGIDFINDSKATNVESTLFAFSATSKPTILLLGGQAKKQDFNLLFKKIPKNIKHIIIYGEDRYYIFNFAENKKSLNSKIEIQNTLSDAFAKALKLVDKNNVILLSPACASYDEFKNYEERGDFFKDMVENFEK